MEREGGGRAFLGVHQGVLAPGCLPAVTAELWAGAKSPEPWHHHAPAQVWPGAHQGEVRLLNAQVRPPHLEAGSGPGSGPEGGRG